MEEFEIKFVNNYPVIIVEGQTIFVDLAAPSISASGYINFLGQKYNVPTHLGGGYNFEAMNKGEFEDCNINVVLGMDILSQYDVIFDYPNSKIIVGPHVQHQGENIPFTFVCMAVIVDATLDGHKYRMLIDSGCKECFAPSQVLTGKIQVGEFLDYLAMTGQWKSMPTYNVKSIVGPLTFETQYALQPYGPAQGVLGYGFLKQHRMTFDFVGHQIWIE